MQNSQIIIKGAREHNLKNIDLALPRDKLIVMTGLSGSGKSSLAFDTIYAEGQRRYVESLSSYARQFLGQMDKPDVDYIEGLSPAISIDQKTTSRNPRSTVGTVTEIHDYLQAHVRARRHAALSEMRARNSAADDRPDRRSACLRCPERTKMLDARADHPRPQGRKHKAARGLAEAGLSPRAHRRRNLRAFRSAGSSRSTKKHTIEAVVDRLVIRPDIQQRLTDSIETAAAPGRRAGDRSHRGRRRRAVFAELRLSGLRHLASTS